MSDIVADTHAAVWYLFEPQRLSADALAAMQAAVASGGTIYVSVISVVEVWHLADKGRVPASVYSDFMTALCDARVAIKPLALDLAIVRAAEAIPRQVLPDMPDRMIAATALHRGLPLVTKDHRIRAAAVATVW